MKKKQIILSVVLILCFLFTTIHTTVFASEWQDTGNIDVSWYKGHEGDTNFNVSTANQLSGLANLVNNGNSFKGKTINLTSDIDLSNYSWTAIGNQLVRFMGTFDGGNHWISGYRIGEKHINTQPVLCGIFGASGGTIKNTNVAINTEFKIIGDVDNAYPFIGSLVADNYGNVINCSTIGYIRGNSCSNIDAGILGGLVGLNSGTITSCNSDLTITDNLDTNPCYNQEIDKVRLYVGGLVGVNSGEVSESNSKLNLTTCGGIIFVGGFAGTCTRLSSIKKCNSATNIYEKAYTSGYASGGFIGRMFGGTITECTSTGKIQNTSSREESSTIEGGFVGVFENDSKISDSSTKVNVSGTKYVGGFAGVGIFNNLTYQYNELFTNCFSIGDVSGYSGASIGGFIGEIQLDQIYMISFPCCYWNKTALQIEGDVKREVSEKIDIGKRISNQPDLILPIEGKIISEQVETKITSIATDLQSPQLIGKSIKLTTTAQGEGTLLYKFMVEKNGKYYFVSALNQNNQATWTPQEAGTYTIHYLVKDSKGIVVRQTKTFEVTKPILMIKDFKARYTSPQVKGTIIFIGASVLGTGTLKYKFEVVKNNVNTFSKSDLSTNYVQWKPTESGQYTVYCYVSDSYGNKVTSNFQYYIK